MTADTKLKKQVHKSLAQLPSQAQVRKRIAENLKERSLLRQVLKLLEQRDHALRNRLDQI